ncbi:M23 family peptidase [Desertihabitans brevis]|uniref:M23 family peptidase n=1 Tax=Desertihabitans brevis TaxID=2268447 RepID=A0A367YVL6_9ACTN|nr:M23 family metallopeptidase [Desertihabitans brevis]RCK69935.1 M23 family peptidase [Desertihabitans brevis]
MNENRNGVVVAVVVGALALVFLPALALLLLMGGPPEGPSCGPGTSGNGQTLSIDPDTVPEGTVAGYGHEQLVNAAYVMQAGKDLDLGVRDITIGVMTAMGESSLRVIDYGDAAGPDSRGLFQQRANGAWGSYEDRMDPYISSTNFFRAMMQVEGRDTLEPTIVAHRTQRNADPYHYTRFWDAAVQVVEHLSGVDTGLTTGPGGGGCTDGTTTPGEVSMTGWAAPSAGPITSPYGMRVHPITGVLKLHDGTDLNGGGCNGPIWAAQDGVVVFRGFDGAGNGTIKVDHGGGVVTAYLHMYESGMLVQEGDEVQAGQQIGKVGSSGWSTGCHLHFSVFVDGSTVDPVPFLTERQVGLG